MPSFETHIYCAAAVGLAGTALAAVHMHWSWPAAALAGLAGCAGGILPDLDSDTSRSVRVVGGLVSLVLAVAAVRYLTAHGMPAMKTAVYGAALLLIFNTLGVWIFKKTTRHRGMFHSLPLALAFGAALAGAFAPFGKNAALVVGAAGAAGVLSHLVLDAVFSLRPGPLKLWSGDFWATAAFWAAAAAASAWAWVTLT